MAIYENIADRAKEKGISLCVLEERAELGAGCISRWKNGTISPTMSSLSKVARELGCTVSELTEGLETQREE